MARWYNYKGEYFEISKFLEARPNQRLEKCCKDTVPFGSGENCFDHDWEQRKLNLLVKLTEDFYD